MKIREMNIGSVYSVDELGRARLSVCPCCGKQFTVHKFVRCCVAPDKGAQNEKSIVGVGCVPVVSDEQKSERRLVLKLKLKNGETSIANLLYATRNESREFTLPRDEQGKFQTATLTVYVPDGKGTQALAKLPSRTLAMVGNQLTVVGGRKLLESQKSTVDVKPITSEHNDERGWTKVHPLLIYLDISTDIHNTF